MTTDDFRRLAMSMPEAVEGEHMNHPDFRVGKKIFATLMPDGEHAMVKLTPPQQRQFVRANPKCFAPVKGGWGERGATQILLKQAARASVQAAIVATWRNTAPRKLVAEIDREQDE